MPRCTLVRAHPTPASDPTFVRVRACCATTELIRDKGDQTMTVEQLTAEIIPRGRGPHRRAPPSISLHRAPPRPPATRAYLPLTLRARRPRAHWCASRAGTVPDEIKSELLQRIRRFAEQS